MPRYTQKFGKVAEEIILINPNLISVRLLNGDYIGPRIVESKLNNKTQYTLFPEDEPIEYTEETVEKIINEGWNIRTDYNKVPELQKLILAAGKVNEPLDLIFSGDRLFPEDGHQRHMAVWMINGDALKRIAFVPARIKKDVNVRDAEHRMLMKDSQVKHSFIAVANLLQRMLDEDLSAGLTEEESKADFIKRSGWNKTRYNNYLAASTLPIDVKKWIEKDIFSTTTIINIMRRKLSLDEKVKIFRDAYNSAYLAGNKKVTGNLVASLANDYEAKKTEILKNAVENKLKTNRLALIIDENLNKDNKNVISSFEEEKENLISSSTSFEAVKKVEELKRVPKIKVPKPKATQKAKVFIELLDCVEPFELEGNKDENLIYLKVERKIWQKAQSIYEDDKNF